MENSGISSEKRLSELFTILQKQHDRLLFELNDLGQSVGDLKHSLAGLHVNLSVSLMEKVGTKSHQTYESNPYLMAMSKFIKEYNDPFMCMQRNAEAEGRWLYDSISKAPIPPHREYHGGLDSNWGAGSNPRMRMYAK